jgi:hypothetical protein
LPDEAQALHHGLAEGEVEAGDQMRSKMLEFHRGGTGAGEGERAASEFHRRGAGGNVWAGERVPVRQQGGGGRGAAAEGGADDRGEQGGDAARREMPGRRFERGFRLS